MTTAGTIRWLNRYILDQHRHPVAYLGQLAKTSTVSDFWLRGLLFLSVPFLAYGLTVDKNQTSQLFILGFLLALLILTFSVGFVTILLGSAAPNTKVWLCFWGSYITSVPLIFAYLLCGFGLLFPLAALMGWGILLPFLLGVFVVDALAIWNDALLHKLHRLINQKRNGTLNGSLPELAQHKNARRIRVGLIVLVLTIGFGAILVDRSLWPGTVVALALASGLIRLDAILLARLGARLIDNRMQLTFSSRNSLFLPTTILERAFRTSVSQVDTAQIMLILRGSALAPSVMRWIQKLPEPQINHLVLHLSFQPGGADVLGYLQPSMSTSTRPWSQLLSALATEATKPDDLQRWIAALDGASDCPVDPVEQWGFERTKIAKVLIQTRRVFQIPSSPDQLSESETALQDWIDSLPNNDGEGLGQRWPEILLTQVKLRNRLHNNVPPRQHIGGFY